MKRLWIACAILALLLGATLWQGLSAIDYLEDMAVSLDLGRGFFHLGKPQVSSPCHHEPSGHGPGPVLHPVRPAVFAAGGAGPICRSERPACGPAPAFGGARAANTGKYSLIFPLSSCKNRHFDSKQSSVWLESCRFFVFFAKSFSSLFHTNTI